MSDFKEIVNCIFVNKDKYWEISDEDKESNFFIINRKFSRKYPKIASFLNSKYVDKPTALDRWFLFFKNQHGIPQWYWGNKTIRKKKNTINKYYTSVMIRENLKEEDIKFLDKYYLDELKNEIKKIKKYEKR
jgi:hypothetical protein